MTQSGATCPTGLTSYTFNNTDHPLCGKAAAAGCASTSFSTNGLTYNKVCGQVRGYQFYDTDAFYDFRSIDSFYVDGVSITYGSNACKHIWTYAGGSKEDDTTVDRCPCNTGFNGDRNPSATFIGSHFIVSLD